MRIPSKAEIEYLKKTYPSGTKVMLDNMDDIQAPPTGTVGEVTAIDSIGQIHVKWGTGSSLALIPGVDSFHKI